LQDATELPTTQLSKGSVRSLQQLLKAHEGTAIKPSLLPVHLHKAKAESGLQKPRSNPKIHPVLKLWQQVPAASCLRSAP